MAEGWYWKHRGELRGPISTEDLDNLIKHRRVEKRDELRPADSSDWLSAEVVKAMFANARADPTDKSTVDAAARLLRQRHLPRANEGKVRSGFSEIPLSGGLKFIATFLSGLLDQVISAIATCLFGLTHYVNRRVALSLAVVLAFSIHLSYHDFSGVENRRIYDQFRQMLTEFRLLHSNQAPDSEWQRLRETSGPVLKSSIDGLNRIALKQPRSSAWWRLDFEEENAEARTELIRAGQELQRLLQAGSSASNITSSENRLLKVQDIFNGKFLDQMKIARSKPPAGEPRRATPAGVDPLFAAIVAVDGILFLGGGFFLWRKLGNPKSQ